MRQAHPHHPSLCRCISVSISQSKFLIKLITFATARAFLLNTSKGLLEVFYLRGILELQCQIESIEVSQDEKIWGNFLHLRPWRLLRPTTRSSSCSSCNRKSLASFIRPWTKLDDGLTLGCWLLHAVSAFHAPYNSAVKSQLSSAAASLSLSSMI